jgi:hypothetical protein
MAFVNQSFPAKQRDGGCGKGATHSGAGTLPLSTLRRLSTARPVLSGKAVWWPLLLPRVFTLLVRRPQSVMASAPCWGGKEFILVFSGKQFKWTLLLADVQFPILGVDFLWHYNLIVDPIANKLLSVAATAHSPPAHVAVVSTSSATMGTHHTIPLWSCSHSGPTCSPHLGPLYLLRLFFLRRRWLL